MWGPSLISFDFSLLQFLKATLMANAQKSDCKRWKTSEVEVVDVRGGAFAAPTEDWREEAAVFYWREKFRFMIDEPGRRRADRRWMNDQSSGQRVRGEPWPAAVEPLKPRVHKHRGSQIRSLKTRKEWEEGDSVSWKSRFIFRDAKFKRRALKANR